MTQVTRIDWTIRTGKSWWSGTDGTVKIEMLRDGTLLKRVNLEPGHTPRLDRAEWVTYYWSFQDPQGIGVSVSGTAVPYTVPFPDGLRGHLRVRFIAQSDDAWEALEIESAVHSGYLRFTPGTIDASVWQSNVDDFSFPGRDVLSTDRSEGATTLTLNY
jgi:hypothetical protein